MTEDNGLRRSKRVLEKKDKRSNEDHEAPPKKTSPKRIAPKKATSKKVPQKRVRAGFDSSEEGIETTRRLLAAQVQKANLAVARDPAEIRTLLLEKYQLEADMGTKTGNGKRAAKARLRRVLSELARENSLHDNRRHHTAVYEDFMYFQNPQHRRNLLQNLKATKKQIADAQKVGRLPTLLTADEGYNKTMTKYVDGLKNGHVGTSSHMNWAALPHQQLHRVTPNPRKTPWGLGKKFPTRLSAIDVRLDNDEIETRRREVEDQRLHSTQAQTHSVHRQDAVNNPRFRENDSTQSCTAAAAGLHIAAKETSADWPTSYDSRDRVADSFICNVSPESNEREAQEDSHSELNEFCRPIKSPRTHYERLTAVRWWGEVTDGRREYHINNDLSPASSVDSSPLSSDAEVGDEDSNPNANLNSDEDANDDDDGDLFTRSYREGSGIGQVSSSAVDDNDVPGITRSRSAAIINVATGPYNDSKPQISSVQEELQRRASYPILNIVHHEERNGRKRKYDVVDGTCQWVDLSYKQPRLQ